MQKEIEEDKLHQFLMGLDESIYGAVKSNMMSRDPLLTLDEAYNVLTQDEESKFAAWINEEHIDGLSFAVQTSPHLRVSKTEEIIRLYVLIAASWVTWLRTIS